MAEIFEFPQKTPKRYVQLATAELETPGGDLDKALAYFVKAYEIRPDYSTNYTIANLLANKRHFREAIEIVDQMINDYYHDGQGVRFLVWLLIQLGEYEDAMEISQGFLEANEALQGGTREERDLFAIIFEYFDQARTRHSHELESQYLVENGEVTHHHVNVPRDSHQYQEFYTKLAAIGNLKVPQQMQLYPELKHMYLDDFIELAKVICPNKKVYPLIRSSVLKLAYERRIDATLGFRWFDNSLHNIQPIKLRGKQIEQSMAAMMAYVTRVIDHKDNYNKGKSETMIEDAHQSLETYYNIFFPFNKSLIKDGEERLFAIAWLDVNYEWVVKAEFDSLISKERNRVKDFTKIMQAVEDAMINFGE
ncbi:MAG: hypothetical protein LBN08_05685 [Lactobacillales bacterium]|nr:hypothetical protein [Lactobacillales bacterium]